MRTFLFVCGTGSEALRHRREFTNSTGTHIFYTWPGDTRTLWSDICIFWIRPIGYMVTELAHMLASTDPTFAEGLAALSEFLDLKIEEGR